MYVYIYVHYIDYIQILQNILIFSIITCLNGNILFPDPWKILEILLRREVFKGLSVKLMA